MVSPAPRLLPPPPLLPPLLLLSMATHAAAAAQSPYLPPPWPANWALNESTYVFSDTADGDARFGLTAFGWAFNKTTVSPHDHHEAAKITAEALRVKAANPSARVLMYLNLELGLGWYDTEAAAQSADPSLFLRYTNGSVIHSDAGPTMIQTFWDYREANVTAYWLEHILAPIVASGSPVDGVLFDDCSGFPNEHASVATAAGIGPAEVAVIKAATFRALVNFTHFLASHGKYSAVYEGMDPTDTNLSRFIYVGTPSNSSASQCVSSMQVRSFWIRVQWTISPAETRDCLGSCVECCQLFKLPTLYLPATIIFDLIQYLSASCVGLTSTFNFCRWVPAGPAQAECERQTVHHDSHRLPLHLARGEYGPTIQREARCLPDWAKPTRLLRPLRSVRWHGRAEHELP